MWEFLKVFFIVGILDFAFGLLRFKEEGAAERIATERAAEAESPTVQVEKTENTAVAPCSTGSDCLNLFSTIGQVRHAKSDTIEWRFRQAYAENPDLAMKILFYARDIRGGLGERSVFRTLLVWLAENERPSLLRNLSHIAEYGRWDDLLVLLDTSVRTETVEVLRHQFEADLTALSRGGEVSLLGKWLPSVNASNKETVRQAKQLARAFGMRDAEYRKALSALRKQIQIIENNLRERDYTFDYAKQPSRAMFKYRRAFMRNDRPRYQSFIAQSDDKTPHTGTLMPYEIVKAAYSASESERRTLDIAWNALEDYTNGENALVVADCSRSMYYGNPQPATVAQSLAIYFAERNRGFFHNHFIIIYEADYFTYPQFVGIEGRDIVEKVLYCRSLRGTERAEIWKIFNLILQTAVENRVPQCEFPSTLYLVSDREFYSRGWEENYIFRECKKTSELFQENGYNFPRVVFWNVNPCNGQQLVRMNEQGVALVSGCTARFFSQIMSGELDPDPDPYTSMMNIIGSDRYAVICA